MNCDRALVLFGYALGKRGSELARIDLEHLHLSNAGCTRDDSVDENEQDRIADGPVFRTINAIEGRGGDRMRLEDVSRRLEAIVRRARGYQASFEVTRYAAASSLTLNSAASHDHGPGALQSWWRRAPLG